MSNPFLTNDMSSIAATVPQPQSPFNVFDDAEPAIQMKSNNPFMTCDNKFDSNHSAAIPTNDLFVSSESASCQRSADLFAFDDPSANQPAIQIQSAFSANAEPTIGDNPFISAPVDSPEDPFGPVESEIAVINNVETSSSSLRIDVSKLDFFNTKGAVSPGVSPRHSPILEEKDFEQPPPIDSTFLADDLSDNGSDDSFSLHEENVIETVVSKPHDDDPFGNVIVPCCDVAKDVPTIGSENAEIPSIEFTNADDKVVVATQSENDDMMFSGTDNDNSQPIEEKSSQPQVFNHNQTSNEDFDAFAAKFESASATTENSKNVIDDAFDPFGSSTTNQLVDTGQPPPSLMGFSQNSAFDPFLSMGQPPKNTPIKLLQLDDKLKDSFDDDDGDDFAVVIRPKMRDVNAMEKEEPTILPLLPPPPKGPIERTPPDSPEQRFNPFNKEESVDEAKDDALVSIPADSKPVPRSTSEDSGTFTPLYDDDTSQPLDDFPAKFDGDGWELMLRQPTKKKITGNRFWKKIYMRIKENNALMLYNTKDDNEPFQELPLQACYSLSEASAQQYDAYGKIFTVKLQYVFYRERVGVRPGQISKVVQGHITSMGQLAKLGLPVQHAPQVSQLLKLGSQSYKELQTFMRCIEDSLFHLCVHRDRALQYKNEEIQVSVYDEFYADINKDGKVLVQQARVRLFFLAFIGGMPDVEVGLNDLEREGKEVVGRHDIIPVVTEEWIRLENCEFHSSVSLVEFEKTKTVKLRPPDACLFELMRFRIRPPRNRELPLHLKISFSVSGSKVEIRGEVLVPGYHSRKHGQVPCEDVCIRIPIPECWIYLFRVEKHFRYGSLKSAHRKAGKLKGLDRLIGAGLTVDQGLIEVSTGQAKYEHAHKAIVWRMQRLPKEGQGAYTTHLMLCRLELTSFDQIPDTLDKFCDVEYVMPASTVSHTTVRSISVTNQNPPEKFVRYLAKYQYKVEIDHNQGKGPCQYVAVASIDKPDETIAEENQDQIKAAKCNASSDDDDSS